MGQSYKFLQVSATIFKVLAFIALVVQVVTGLILLIRGGEPVLIGGAELPVGLVGVLNFVTAAMYFFSFWLVSSLIRLLLDIRGQVGRAGNA